MVCCFILFSDNIGESIVYLWVERVREFLQEKFSEVPAGKLVKVNYHKKPKY